MARKGEAVAESESWVNRLRTSSRPHMQGCVRHWAWQWAAHLLHTLQLPSLPSTPSLELPGALSAHPVLSRAGPHSMVAHLRPLIMESSTLAHGSADADCMLVFFDSLHTSPNPPLSSPGVNCYCVILVVAHSLLGERRYLAPLGGQSQSAAFTQGQGEGRGCALSPCEALLLSGPQTPHCTRGTS